MVTQPRHGRPRQRAKAKLRERWEPCHLCGLPIPRDVDPNRHPLRSTIDELVPLSYGGSPTDPANLAHAHACCNSSRGNRPLGPPVYQAARAVSQRHHNALQAVLTRTW